MVDFIVDEVVGFIVEAVTEISDHFINLWSIDKFASKKKKQVISIYCEVKQGEVINGFPLFYNNKLFIGTEPK